MGSMAQTGLLLVPSDALGHTWALVTRGPWGRAGFAPRKWPGRNLKRLRPFKESAAQQLLKPA